MKLLNSPESSQIPEYDAQNPNLIVSKKKEAFQRKER